MIRFKRAAALAAAVLTIATTGALAFPSQASEVTAPAVTIAYVDHAVATIDASQFVAPPVTSPDPLETPPARPLATLVDDHATDAPASGELDCLATAVYFESKGEPLKGQLAVAEVIVNRAKSGRFPATLCGVVKQKSQFSFVRGGSLPAVPRASAHWRTAVAIAHIAAERLADQVDDRTMFFHARHVAPAWRGRVRMASIGNHIFYR
jgi:hypothetical protein